MPRRLLAFGIAFIDLFFLIVESNEKRSCTGMQLGGGHKLWWRGSRVDILFMADTTSYPMDKVCLAHGPLASCFICPLVPLVKYNNLSLIVCQSMWGFLGMYFAPFCLRRSMPRIARWLGRLTLK